MRTTRELVTLLLGALLTAGVVAGCDEGGPAERAGKRIDRAVDKLSGKGPAEKAGERVDKAIDELTKK